MFVWAPAVTPQEGNGLIEFLYYVALSLKFWCGVSSIQQAYMISFCYSLDQFALMLSEGKIRTSGMHKPERGVRLVSCININAVRRI